jgi:hypothetical protein
MAKDLIDIFKKGFDKGGHPKIVKTVDELVDGINSYYNSIVESTLTEEGKEITYFNRPTITGLALHLGYATRQSIYDNQKNEEYSYILKKAITFIEQYHEESLGSKNVTGHIFALKNMGWSDKMELETIERDKVKTDYSKLSTEELKEFQELQSKLES